MTLQVFKNAGFEIRAVMDEHGEPWFVAKDVCDILGIKNPSDAIKSLDDDERSRKNLGRQGEANLVSESGLYSLVLRSNKPDAKRFRKWLTSEVIPSIRKHGMYATAPTIEAMIEDPEFAIKLLTTLKEEKEALLEAERKNSVLMHVNKTYTATEIAKELGFKSAMAMNKELNKRGVQFHQNGTWVLYSKYSGLGYEQIKQEVLDNGRVVYHRRWTQDGRAFLIDLFGCEQ